MTGLSSFATGNKLLGRMNEEIELRAKKLLLHMVSIFIGEVRDAEELSNLTGLGVNHAAPCIDLCEACTAYKTYVSVENH